MKSISGQNWTVYNADCRQAFRALPARSVHCIMTSPPYWGGIRDYGIPPAVWGDGWEGCYGNEPTVEQYVAHTIEVFDALGHALRDDGVIWWNIGDTYAASGKGGGGGSFQNDDVGTKVGAAGQRRKPAPGFRQGDKSLVPFRVALGLQASGWIVRQDVIWRKPSPMPESIDGVRWERCRLRVAASSRSTYDRHIESQEGVNKPHAERNGRDFLDQSERFRDCPGCPKCADHGGYVLRRGSWRPTTSHEFVFQITKNADYFCDAAAAQEATTGNAHSRGKGTHPKSDGAVVGMDRQNGDFSAAVRGLVETRNPRSVWSISSEAYKGKHFAAFPTMLAWKCIQASTSAGGCCAACGAQYAPVVEKGRIPTRPGNETKVGEYQVLDPDSPYQGHAGTICGNRDPQRHIAVKRTTGYRPTCDCNAGAPVPAVVADPFTGSGTVLQVAINTGRQFVGSEIAEHYLPLIQQRAETPWVPRTEKRPKPKKKKHHRRQLTLIE